MNHAINLFHSRVLGIFLLGAMLSVQVNAQETPETIVGDWAGALSLPTGNLRIVFHISQDAEGKLSATMDSPDQQAFGIATSSTHFADGKLTIEAAAIQGKYVGTLSEDGQSLSGEWSQGPATLPLALSKTEEENLSHLSK